MEPLQFAQKIIFCIFHARLIENRTIPFISKRLFFKDVV